MYKQFLSVAMVIKWEFLYVEAMSEITLPSAGSTFVLQIFLQEEFDDDDEWNPCKAAGVCLMLMATCCEDDIINYVLPFVKDNVQSQDWKYRDAAVMAFGKELLFLKVSLFTKIRL